MNKMLAVAAVIAIFSAGLGGGFWLGANQGGTSAARTSSGAAGASRNQVDSKQERTVLYWHDPMVPGHRFERPGKSPFMDMDLVPVYAGEAADAGGAQIAPQVQQNLGVRVVEVVSKSLAPRLQVVGSIGFNERDVRVVTARTTGYVDRLFVRALYDPVRAGQPLAELLAPEWAAAQEEYLALRRSAATDTEPLLQAARQRLIMLGMPEDVIRTVEQSGSLQLRVTLSAPMSGVIGELTAREGMTVLMGTPLFRINGLTSVWIRAELPETQAALVNVGDAATARVAAYPNQSFQGKLAALLPEVDPTTRTVTARIEVPNPNASLKPGMFVNVEITPAPVNKNVVVVPSEALIRTGLRNVVILALEGGSFRPVEVESGREVDGLTEIRTGLQAGQRVVASAQFLIDSEASIKASFRRLGDMPAAPKPGTHRGEAVIEAVHPDRVTLSHGPVPSLNWPAMTMDFKLPARGPPFPAKVGDRVVFEFISAPGGGFEISAVRTVPEGRR
jgi:Cu(I)/Ag(I) efflux system membrane fusion protein